MCIRDRFVIAGNRVQRTDADGQLLQTYESTSPGFGGLHLLEAPLTLRDSASSSLVNLPAGTLLVFGNNDNVDALDPATDTILASLDPAPNFSSPIGGVYNSNTGTLFFLDGSPDQIIEVDPSTGGELARFDAPTDTCLLYTSPSPRDATLSRMPSSA